MPAALRYDPSGEAVRKAAKDELLSRRGKAALAMDYYAGRHKKHLTPTKFDDQHDDNVVINLWKQLKDREVAFLFPRMLNIELDDARDTEPEQWLADAWQANGGARFLQRLGLYGALFGHVFVRVTPPDPDYGEEYPRLSALHPANVLAFWQADDYERVLWYEIYYDAAGMEHRQDIVREGGAWHILYYRREKGDNYGAEKPWVTNGQEDWPYSAPPVLDWRHLETPGVYYGDNEDMLLGHNDQLNKVASDISRILRFHASPRTIGTGFKAPDLVATSINHLWTIENPQAKVFNLEMQTDLSASLAFAGLLKDTFLAEARTVILKGDAADFQRVTNLGVKTVFMDQLAKNASLQLQWTPGLQGLCRTMLEVGGKPAPIRIKLMWGDPLPVDGMESINIAEKEIDLGLTSRQTAALERGRNWELEQERIEAEDSTNDTAVMRQLRGEVAGASNPLISGSAARAPSPTLSGRDSAM